MNLKKMPFFNIDLLNGIGEKKFTLLAIGFFLIIAVSWNAFLYLGYEGGWNLVARALNNEASIHRDLHYLLPNFYPEFFRFCLNFFGSDLGPKIVSILVFTLIPLLSFLILKKETNNLSERKIIYLSLLIPFICLMFKPLRIEDYHSISITGFLLTAYLMHFKRFEINALSFIPIAVVLMNRIHDGVFLVIGSILVVFIRRGGIKGFLWFIFISIFMINTLNYFDPEYAREGILSSSASTKGISFFSILFIPLNVLFNFMQYVGSLKGLIFISLTSSLFYLFINYKRKSTLINNLFWILTFSTFIQIIFFPSHLLVLILFLNFFLFYKTRLVKKIGSFYSYLIILSAYFFSSCLSSGGSFIELFPQSALLLIPLIIFVDSKKTYSIIANNFFHPLYFSVLMALIINLVYRPFGWHNYASPKLMSRFEFQNGHLLSRTTAIISEKICPVIEGKTTFSTPFSFYIYHCNAIQWKHAITTFYDTSDSKWINHLSNELIVNPPNYIVYNRQISLMFVHSDIFNKGRKIPNFKLDEEIMRNINQGVWKVLYVFSMDGQELFASNEFNSFTRLQDIIKDTDNVIYLIDTNN